LRGGTPGIYGLITMAPRQAQIAAPRPAGREA
jgi:hypothetical protein